LRRQRLSFQKKKKKNQYYYYYCVLLSNYFPVAERWHINTWKGHAKAHEVDKR
jgi:hypothetical protein